MVSPKYLSRGCLTKELHFKAAALWFKMNNKWTAARGVQIKHQVQLLLFCPVIQTWNWWLFHPDPHWPHYLVEAWLSQQSGQSDLFSIPNIPGYNKRPHSNLHFNHQRHPRMSPNLTQVSKNSKAIFLMTIIKTFSQFEQPLGKVLSWIRLL